MDIERAMTLVIGETEEDCRKVLLEGSEMSEENTAPPEVMS